MREEGVDMIMCHLRVDPTKVAQEAHDTRGAHARFSFLEKIYKGHLRGALDVDVNGMQVEYHCALRCYLLFLVGTSMFVEKSTTYVDVVYLKYFTDLTAIHEYN
ncbi:unnamed protein product [Lathyrus oleraceus]